MERHSHRIVRIEFPLRGCLDRMLNVTMQQHQETVIIMRNMLIEFLEDFIDTSKGVGDAAQLNVAEAMLAGIKQNIKITQEREGT